MTIAPGLIVSDKVEMSKRALERHRFFRDQMSLHLNRAKIDELTKQNCALPACLSQPQPQNG